MQVNNNINAMQSYTNALNDNAKDIASTTNASATPEAQQAQSVNETTQSTGDITRDLTDNISIENGFDAQINSIQTQNEMYGTLLNITG